MQEVKSAGQQCNTKPTYGRVQRKSGRELEAGGPDKGSPGRRAWPEHLPDSASVRAWSWDKDVVRVRSTPFVAFLRAPRVRLPLPTLWLVLKIPGARCRLPFLALLAFLAFRMEALLTPSTLSPLAAHALAARLRRYSAIREPLTIWLGHVATTS